MPKDPYLHSLSLIYFLNYAYLEIGPSVLYFCSPSRSFLAFTTVPFLAVFGQLMRLIAMRGTAHFSEASTATEIFCLLELHAPIMSLYSRLRYKVYVPSGS